MHGLLLLIGIVMMTGNSQPAQAQTCAASEYAGNWQNVRSETNMLSALEVVDTCDQTSAFGALKIRAEEVCNPRHCSWGWTAAIIHNDQLFAEFKTFIATRRISAVRQGLRLRVLVETDYITETREDTKISYIMVRSAD